MTIAFWAVALLLCSASFISVRLKKLTPAGGITGACTGGCVYGGAGLTGLSLLAAFFILGTAATSWHRKYKQEFESERERSGRTAGQVLANGGMAGLLGLAAFIDPERAALFMIMLAASLSSATADTLSSELGTIYGRRFYNILSFKRDSRGLDGVISLEGTAAGLTGSIIIAAIYAAGYGWSPAFWWIVMAGTLGNMADSLLGATLERRALLSNNTVNFLNTAAAAVVALLLSFL